MIKFFTVIFIYLLFLNGAKCVTLENSEKICFDNLLTNLGLNNGINCSNTDIVSCISNGGIFVDTLSLKSQNISYEISQRDFECFSKIIKVTIRDSKVSSSFLKGPFPSLINIYIINCSIVYSDLFLTPISSNLTLLSISSIPPQYSPIIIKLSYIKNLKSFFFLLNYVDTSTDWISLLNDFAAGGMNTVPQLTVDLKDIPVMDNIQTNSINFRTYNSPSVSGYNNIQTLINIERIYLSIITGYSEFNQFTLIPKNNSLLLLYFSTHFYPPTKMIDITNLEKLNYIDLKNVLTGFAFGGRIPLILPQSVTTFLISESKFTGVKEFIDSYPNLVFVSVGSNQITGNFSDWKNRGYTSFNVENNLLQGSVDPSWCITLAYFGYNKLSGELPSCYACHLLSVNVNNMAYGSGGGGGGIGNNNFTIPTCTTLIPNLRYIPTSQQLILYGSDLGFISSDIKGSNYGFNPIIYSKLFVANNVMEVGLPKFIDLYFQGANKTFTLSTIQKSPVVTLITASIQDDLIILEGSYFNYNTSSIQIMVGNSQCSIISSTFFKVECLLLGSNDKNTIAQVTINVRDYYYEYLEILKTNVFAYLNQTTQVKNCLEDCNSLGDGFCNTLIGKCEFKCPNNCTNPLSGTCDTLTGICNCSTNYQGEDCSIPFVHCDSDCSSSLNQGICNDVTGICNCLSNYQGSDCSIPSHFITSVIPCSIDGGEVIINGWFGNNYDGSLSSSSYNVIIGNLDCIIASINQTTIKCNLGAGTGTKNIKIINSIHSNVVFNGIGLFNYQNPIKTCPNSCTSLQNGKCNIDTGYCQCNDKFSGFDCSVPKSIVSPPTNTSINKDTGDVELINQDTTYEISIISLNEISFDGSTIIKSHSLKGNWSIEKDNQETTSTATADSNIYRFSQQLINNTCTILYTIEEIKLKDKSFTFGTTTFTVEKDSIKLSVLVKAYQYQSSLNTLQLVFYSAAANTNDNNDCNKKDTTIDTSNANNQQNSNYIQISKNSKTLVGRFINQVIADSRSTFMSSTIINDSKSSTSSSSVLLGLNLPHCNECFIDPDFSILVESDYKDSCDQSNKKNKWLIPVAVVVPVVGCAAIIIVSMVLFKKHRYSIKVFAIKLKTFKK
ncbi:hypothetical protein ACTA71_006873 [Dictyostelium dimigraforme]